MTTDKNGRTQDKRDHLEGTRPDGDKESRREKHTPESTAGEAPIDPADEDFIESSRTS